MAELTLGMDPIEPRFSSNFLDQVDPSASESSSVPQPEPSGNSPIQTNPFRSESPTPSDPGVELDHDAPGFNFAAHLETRDSTSSLDQVGIPSPASDASTSPAHQSGVNGVSPDSIEKVETNAGSKTLPTLVARTSEHWETFDENGQKMTEPHPPTANGGHSGGQDKESVEKGQSVVTFVRGVE